MCFQTKRSSSGRSGVLWGLDMLANDLCESAAVHKSSKTPLAGKRILLAEDEALIALEMKDILEGLGCEVVGPLSSIDKIL